MTLVVTIIPSRYFMILVNGHPETSYRSLCCFDTVGWEVASYWSVRTVVTRVELVYEK